MFIAGFRSFTHKERIRALAEQGMLQNISYYTPRYPWSDAMKVEINQEIGGADDNRNHILGFHSETTTSSSEDTEASLPLSNSSSSSSLSSSDVGS